MSEATGLKHISDEAIKKAAEAWFNQAAARVNGKRFADLHETVQNDIQRDARDLLHFIEEFQ